MHIDKVRQQLQRNPKRWLITGVAGFIGCNLLEELLGLDQWVVGLDNFATGHRHNLRQIQGAVTPAQWARFTLVESDIRNLADCRRAMSYPPSETPSPSQAEGQGGGRSSPIDYVLHQAALGSVPRSLEDPLTTNATNIDGFLNILVAARDAGVKRLVYAASSSTYGDHPDLPKVEDRIGKPLSPYAVTKLVNELYADVFARIYGFQTIGLRYFNIFGPRQDPNGAYAAVLPKWTAAMIQNQPVCINGDGETSRDFCYIANAVQANLLAATVGTLAYSTSEPAAKAPLPGRERGWGEGGASQSTVSPERGVIRPGGDDGNGEGPVEDPAVNQVYNVAVGERTTLNDLFEAIRSALEPRFPHLKGFKPSYRDFRPGDVRHSLADIGKARTRLGYQPTHRIKEGLLEAMDWYVHDLK